MSQVVLALLQPFQHLLLDLGISRRGLEGLHADAQQRIVEEKQSRGCPDLDALGIFETEDTVLEFACQLDAVVAGAADGLETPGGRGGIRGDSDRHVYLRA